jgi:hypothetical protein
MTRGGTHGVDQAREHQEGRQEGGNYEYESAKTRVLLAASGIRLAHAAALFGAGMLGEGVYSFEELLVDDEGKTEHE